MYYITRQSGFALRPDHWTIEKDGEILEDEDGNSFIFESRNEAEEYLQSLKEDRDEL